MASKSKFDEKVVPWYWYVGEIIVAIFACIWIFIKFFVSLANMNGK